jgi:hypothetical protein
LEIFRCWFANKWFAGYVAPTELENLFLVGFYKDVAPTALGKRISTVRIVLAKASREGREADEGIFATYLVVRRR